MEKFLKNKKILYVLLGLIMIVAIIVFAINISHGNEDSDTTETIEVDMSIDEIVKDVPDVTKNEIMDFLYKRFSFVKDNFALFSVQEYIDGEYYAVVLSYKDSTDQVTPDLYRLVLLKTIEGWEIVAFPALVLSYEDYPLIPHELIYVINRIN